MSYDPCKYCGEMAFKTDGNADLICQNRAETGSCAPVNTLEDAKANAPLQPGGYRVRKSQNCICGECGKKMKHCKGRGKCAKR
jgi:hypothetical protein